MYIHTQLCREKVILTLLVTIYFIMTLNVLNIEMWSVYFKLYYCTPGLSDIGYNQ